MPNKSPTKRLSMWPSLKRLDILIYSAPKNIGPTLNTRIELKVAAKHSIPHDWINQWRLT